MDEEVAEGGFGEMDSTMARDASFETKIIG